MSNSHVSSTSLTISVIVKVGEIGFSIGATQILFVLSNVQEAYCCWGINFVPVQTLPIPKFPIISCHSPPLYKFKQY